MDSLMLLMKLWPSALYAIQKLLILLKIEIRIAQKKKKRNVVH